VTELLRHLAPLSDRAWKELEDTAREVLSLHMAARRLMDVEGPHGFGHSALDLGRVEVLEGAPPGAVIRRRRVRPLIELRVPFDLSRAELEALERGAGDAEQGPLVDAARLFAAAEDAALFEGYAAGEVPGLVADSDHEPVALPEDAIHMPDAVALALERLRQAGVAGPYAMALGPDAWAALHMVAGEGGYPVVSHVRRLLDGPLVWAPSLRGGAVLSLRGGDFRLVLGRDASLGYLSHDDVRVRLFLEETFQAELLGPEAAVALLPRGAPRAGSRAARPRASHRRGRVGRRKKG
jgi:uncharacterized linocin/CFP29 family protein